MPRLYLLTCTLGSSLDQSTNNVSLFHMIEQVNVPQGQEPPPNAQLPLEVHAYFYLDGREIGEELELRYVLVSNLGLEASSETFRYRIATPRFRTRTMGLPVPPLHGHYELRVDFRRTGETEWRRDPLAWPLSFLSQTEPKPTVTH